MRSLVLWVAVLVGARGAWGVSMYSVTAVPMPQGATDTYAQGIDAAGDVFMTSGFESADQSTWTYQPYEFSGGALRPMEIPAAMTGGEIVSVNAEGTAVGAVIDAAGNTHPAIWQQGAVRLLDAAGFDGGYANYINNVGQVVGLLTNAAPPDDGSTDVSVLWNQGAPTLLVDAAGRARGGGVINDLGQMVVISDPVEGVLGHIGILQGGVVTAIAGSPGYWVGVQGINNHGEIIGTASNDVGYYDNHPFLEKDGVFTILPRPGDDLFTLLESINDEGQIVGRGASSTANSAYLLEDGVFYDLNDLIPAESGWQIFDATSINDSGVILAAGGRGNGVEVLVLTPVPEPGSLVLLGLGVAGILGRKRR